MTALALLQRLRDDHRSLIEALDSDDADAIETAAAALHGTVRDARGHSLWNDGPEVAVLARQVSRMTEAARIRVNLLTDLNERRLQALAAIQGRASGLHYGRDGRRSA